MPMILLNKIVLSRPTGDPVIFSVSLKNIFFRINLFDFKTEISRSVVALNVEKTSPLDFITTRNEK